MIHDELEDDLLPRICREDEGAIASLGTLSCRLGFQSMVSYTLDILLMRGISLTEV